MRQVMVQRDPKELENLQKHVEVLEEMEAEANATKNEAIRRGELIHSPETEM